MHGAGPKGKVTQRHRTHFVLETLVDVCESSQFYTEILPRLGSHAPGGMMLQFPQLSACLVCAVSVRSNAGSVGQPLFSSVG